jgi:hypothetical protein
MLLVGRDREATLDEVLRDPPVASGSSAAGSAEKRLEFNAETGASNRP